MSPSAAELLALDALTLREADGGALDLAAQARRIQESLHCAHALGVWREGQLVAYVLLQPQELGRAFVRGFCLHPDWRQAGVLLDLLRAVLAWVTEHGVSELHSHVRKGNAESLALHRQLGFAVVAENEWAYAFVAHAEALTRHPVLRRAARN
ncbi:RimJ/RimL family protein N-acetyltransferase [Inhella inkyongensis]|uniref:RimJ/RimL family protein N-acetyltransferase n=1 Tax=Inhella inkyongensis TaxID=392593 RepID=A0A840S1N5_9BURK|nr:GNAT family N-acetyltransferase [Inhella inkyongensis]MBB5202996.1 RimJ/RimL family protein N-acetyltransferase [Inhella inkyongensis]